MNFQLVFDTIRFLFQSNPYFPTFMLVKLYKPLQEIHIATNLTLPHRVGLLPRKYVDRQEKEPRKERGEIKREEGIKKLILRTHNQKLK